MPVYEYECRKCKHSFEMRRGINQEPLEECIFCTGKVKKLVSTCNFDLIGSGFYKSGFNGGRI